MPRKRRAYPVKKEDGAVTSQNVAVKGRILYDSRSMKRILMMTLFLFGCTAGNETEKNWTMHEICGRDEHHTYVYRIKSPKEWKIVHPEKNEDLSDSIKSLCEFVIQDESGEIKITIHNFTSKSIEERIPPLSQIMRWKKQFEELDQESVTITPQSYSGFTGLLFEATGFLNGKSQTMICWSMQIAKEHYRILENEQMKADYTIKIVGLKGLVKDKTSEIIKFARSFELINEIGYEN